MKSYPNFLSLGVILIFLSIGKNQVAFPKDTQNKNPVLSFACVNTYWPGSGSQASSADVMTSPFGIRYESADGYDFHEGLDIRANFQPVYTFTDGNVDDKGQETSGAYFVRLRHVDPCGGSTFFTYYTHLDNDALYTNLQVESYLNAGQIFVTSGISGAINPHLHFAGMVGGTSTLTNTINPMRDDSLPYNNNPPADILIMDSNTRDMIFQIQTPENDLDLNEIKVTAFAFGGSEEDSFSMNFDTRQGVDAKFHCPAQNCENGDEDGYVVETTAQQSLTVSYELSSFDFNPDFQDFHIVQVDLDYPAWSFINELRIRATDTQNVSIEHQVFIANITINRTLNGIIDLYGYRSAFYSGEKELHLENGNTLTIQTGSILNLIDDVNFVIDAGATLNIESGVICNFGADAEIIVNGTFNDASGQCNWNQLACILVEAGGIYKNTSSNTFTIDSGAFLAARGGTFELPDAGTVFESGSYWDIDPGSTIKVKPNRNITFKAGAYIDAVGTASSPITFTSADGTPSRSEWGTVYIYSNNNTVEHCTIEGSDWGLKFYGTPTATSGNVVRNCTLKKNDQAIRAENTQVDVTNCTLEDNRHAFVLINNTSQTGGIYLDGNTVRNNDRDGIYSINSVVDVFNTTLDNNGMGNVSTYHGIYASTSSDIALGTRYYSSNSEGYNTLINNHGAGIYRSSSSNVLAGYYVKAGTEQAGYNSIYNNGTQSGTYSGKDIYNLNIGTTYAHKIYWGSSGGPASGQFYGPVDYSNWLSFPPGPWGPEASIEASPMLGSSGSHKKSGRGNTLTSDEDTQLKLQQIAQFKATIAARPNSPQAVEALRRLYSFVRTDWQNKLVQRSTIYGYLSGLYTSQPNIELGRTALQLMIIDRQSRGKYTEAITLATTARSKLTSTARQENLVNLVIMNLHTGQTQAAQSLFGEFKSAYPNEKNFTQLLQEMFDDLQNQQNGIPGKTSNDFALLQEAALNESDTNIPAEFALEPNYPNPFNPATTIRYRLAERSPVTIKIYNMMGQKVRTLFDGQKDAGLYEIQWNGKNDTGVSVTSGIYVVRMAAGDFVRSQTLSFMK